MYAHLILCILKYVDIYCFSNYT